MELANLAHSTKYCNEGSEKEAPQELAICSYNGEVPVFGSYARERGRERDSITVELKELASHNVAVKIEHARI